MATGATTDARFGSLADWYRLCRPAQWSKNAFVVAPLIFSDSYRDIPSARASLLALVAFSLVSSAIYVLNDILDIEADRQHPRKSSRPLASGRVSIPTAIALVAILFLNALILAFSLLPAEFLFFMGLYVGNSIAYCLWLKHKVIADVLLISIGFVLRLLAGCAAIGVEPSEWLIVCGFSLALLLGFGKRRTEIVNLPTGSSHRPVLMCYDAAKLDTLLSVSTALCLLSYMLYTMSPETVRRHGTTQLVYTVPFVAYGLFRYLFKAQEGKGDGPTEIILEDRVQLLNGLIWIGSVVLILSFTAHRG